ncbi:MAG: response regulator transcription factor [bacterium]|nr:response regulator transcription factor [bacterium]MCM1374774.1 response regulator transcription factor [Muribaculum sp.]
MRKILIIEDDMTINGLLRNILGKNGYLADSAYNGTDGLAMGLHEEYDLVLLDLMLPEKSGAEIIRELRKARVTPIIILSAKGEIQDRIELLRLGADDYITKPFDIDEVLLRIQAVLRRTAHQDNNELVFHELTIKPDSKRVFIGDVELACTATEYAILELLLKNPARIFSKRTLYEMVMGEDYLQEDNTMNVHISNLRRKIARHTDRKYIETVYGMGYRLIR